MDKILSTLNLQHELIGLLGKMITDVYPETDWLITELEVVDKHYRSAVSECEKIKKVSV